MKERATNNAHTYAEDVEIMRGMARHSHHVLGLGQLLAGD